VDGALLAGSKQFSDFPIEPTLTPQQDAVVLLLGQL
jgi:hypothetical protein